MKRHKEKDSDLKESPRIDPSEGTNTLTPCFQISGLQMCETINFYCLSHSVCE